MQFQLNAITLGHFLGDPLMSHVGLSLLMQQRSANEVFYGLEHFLCAHVWDLRIAVL